MISNTRPPPAATVAIDVFFSSTRPWMSSCSDLNLFSRSVRGDLVGDHGGVFRHDSAPYFGSLFSVAFFILEIARAMIPTATRNVMR